jgi:phosphoadenosine phosphosulfate reductase
MPAARSARSSHWRALGPFDAWINGRKRHHGGDRAALPMVERVDGRIKLNPLAAWGAAEIEGYFRQHDLPRHPLVAEGYASIGCMPCTTPIREGESAREGRWRGRAKAECGIHLTGVSS